MDEREEVIQGYISRINPSQIIIGGGLFGVALNEIVYVGNQKIVGEVIKLDGDSTIISLYEDAVGLQVGDRIICSGSSLSIELGPGLIGQIFDGLQNPLAEIAEETDSLYIPRAANNFAPLDHTKLWYFEPNKKLSTGSFLSGGDIYGQVKETPIFTHRLCLQPDRSGRITYLAPEGSYTLNDTVLRLEEAGRETNYKMSYKWPVHKPRPVAETLRSDQPLFVNIRAIDSLFPITHGSTVTMPGVWGCSKGHVMYYMSKYANIDAYIQVGSGDRSMEAVEHILSLPEGTTPDNQNMLMSRSVLISNTVGMANAAREASIYTAVTIAEYFRDMGYNICLVSDSTSRWVQALLQTSLILGETPIHYARDKPGTLYSKLDSFYGRAGNVLCQSSSPCSRKGSVTILSTVVSSGEWESDPEIAKTWDTVSAFWFLDVKLAQRRHYPSISWRVGFSKCYKLLEPYYKREYPGWIEIRKKMKEILELETDIIQQGEERELSEKDKVVLAVAKMIREDFLQQNCFTPYDRQCPFWKLAGMMKNFVKFYELAVEAVERRGMSFDALKKTEGVSQLMQRLCCMKFQEPFPRPGEEGGRVEIDEKYRRLYHDLDIIQN
eukprot:TRINITY_DN1841_c0_g1_i2.p1 TRINITY_DN1841_c0_g1~~TRINITY_DN1841_c0_g1_i2.p1  ORF type:complete len:608 (-),score=89.68 TRINITY_DN1841_c0_g1_i2:77-1900(-)